MDSGNKNEMEQIQRGLEEFLDRELDVIGQSREEHREERKRDSTDSIHVIGQSSGAGQPVRRHSPMPEQAMRQQSSGAGQPVRRQSREPESCYETESLRVPNANHGAVQSSRAGQPVRRHSPMPEQAGRQQSSGAGQPVSPQKKKAAKAKPSAKKEQPEPEKRPRKRQAVQEEPQMAAKASDSGKSKKRQKKKRRKSRFMRFLVAVALIVLLLGVGWYKLVGVVYAKMSFKEIASLTVQPMGEDGVVNILLIGNDSRTNDESGRSDAMILLSVSNKTKTIYMTSMLRDIYVDIPGHDGNRLNAAYSFGGAELLMETIEKNFDIPVNRYVLVNFEAFASLVDAAGGIDLELSKEEIEYVNGYLWEYNVLTERPEGTDYMDTSEGGLVHLNGPQALAYSRNRYIGTDFGRTERQRKVLTAVIKKLPTALLTNAGELMDGLLPNLTTNLTQEECFRLSLMAGKLLTYDIVSDNIPQPNTYTNATIRKMQVLQVDFEANKKYLREKIYGE